MVSLHGRVTVVMIGILMMASVQAQEEPTRAVSPTDSSEAIPIPVETYIQPNFKKQGKSGQFPVSEIGSGREGWVVVNLMVDPQGKPYEVSVIDSMGGHVFEKEALRMVNAMLFEPATLNGVPVDAEVSFPVKFLANVNGATPKFVSDYKRFTVAIKRDDRPAADMLRGNLQAGNLYEDAYQNLGDFLYYQKWGTEAQQLTALQRAVAYAYGHEFLRTDVVSFVLTNILALQLKKSDFGGALQTYDRLDSKLKNSPSFLQTIANIKALQTDDQTYTVTDEIPEGSSWFFKLLKPGFSIETLTGAITEVKLRCQRKYVMFPFKPGIKYSIAGKYGACNMELIGTPGTKFVLTQSPRS